MFYSDSGRGLSTDTAAEECLFAAVLELSGLQELWHIPVSLALLLADTLLHSHTGAPCGSQIHKHTQLFPSTMCCSRQKNAQPLDSENMPNLYTYSWWLCVTCLTRSNTSPMCNRLWEAVVQRLRDELHTSWLQHREPCPRSVQTCMCLCATMYSCLCDWLAKNISPSFPLQSYPLSPASGSQNP